MSDHPLVVGVSVLAGLAGIIALLLAVLGGSSDSDAGDEAGGTPTLTLPSLSVPADFGSCDDPTIRLSQGRGPSGTEVTVTGTGFDPDSDVDLDFHVTSMAPGHTDGRGSFTADVVVPGDLDPFAPKQFSIVVHTGACSDSAPFELTR